MAILMRRLAHLGLCCAAALTICGTAAADISLEYAVKAAYLAKFVPFIDWPQAAFATPGAPVNICVLGSDPFDGALDRAATAQGGQRPLAVRRLSSPDLASACQILYLADDQAAASLPPAMRDRPVVTVAEAGHGNGIINFVIEGNHVRFDIDDDAALHSGVRISSKLLSLAHAVKHRGSTP